MYLSVTKRTSEASLVDKMLRVLTAEGLQAVIAIVLSVQ